MNVEREEVQRVARLAALAVDEQSLDELTRQISRILDYVSQIESVGDAASEPARGYPGPRQPLREDLPHRTPLALPLGEIAPLFRDGLFLVPRLGAVGDPAGATDDEP